MLVDIERIKVDNRIRKEFGEIEELAKDIAENGLINPPVVTPDMKLLAGERRLRACKALGMKQIEVRPMTVHDALHELQIEISENECRKDFTFSERYEWAKRLYEEYKGYGKSNGQRADDRAAKESGIGNKDTLKKADFIMKHATPEMIRELDDGALSINGAYKKLKAENESLRQANHQWELDEKHLSKKLEELYQKTVQLEEEKERIAAEAPSSELDKVNEQLSQMREQMHSIDEERKKALTNAEFYRSQRDTAIKKRTEFESIIDELEKKLQNSRNPYCEASIRIAGIADSCIEMIKGMHIDPTGWSKEDCAHALMAIKPLSDLLAQTENEIRACKYQLEVKQIA